jgi:hypothetical protein
MRTSSTESEILLEFLLLKKEVMHTLAANMNTGTPIGEYGEALRGIVSKATKLLRKTSDVAARREKAKAEQRVYGKRKRTSESLFAGNVSGKAGKALSYFDVTMHDMATYLFDILAVIQEILDDSHVAAILEQVASDSLILGSHRLAHLHARSDVALRGASDAATTQVMQAMYAAP